MPETLLLSVSFVYSQFSLSSLEASKVESHALIEEGNMVFLKAENKMIWRTSDSEGWFELKDSFSPTLTKVGIGLGVGVAVGLAAPSVATAALGVAGFSAGGVGAGSIAAGIQASIGNVAAGSVFASRSQTISYFSSLKICPYCSVSKCWSSWICR